MLFLLLAAAEPQTAVDAERAFAADAQALGQWTAFRKWAAPHATMFLPKPVDAPEAIHDWRDPPKAVKWAPAASYLSCDGAMAANTGPWTRPNGTVGYFSTIWVKRADGAWRWDVDGGDTLATPRPAPARVTVRRAACTGTPVVQPELMPEGPGATGYGHSRDGTLQWAYAVDAAGARVFTVDLWDGKRMARVIDDHIAAPPPAPAPTPTPAPTPAPAP